MAEHRIKMKAHVFVYRGRYIWQQFQTTTFERAEWAKGVIEKKYPKRRVEIRHLRKDSWRHKSCLTVGKFYRKGKLIRRLYFDTTQVAKTMGSIWKSNPGASFRFVDLTKAWRKEHADLYKRKKKEKSRRA